MKYTVIFTPACGESASMPADLCSGLRRSISGAFVPRPPLETFANGSWVPLCTLTDGERPASILLAAAHPDKSGRYPLATATTGNPVPETLGSLESEALCAAPTCYGAVVMTADGPQHIIRDKTDGHIFLAGGIPPVRPVRIEAESRGTIAMTIGPETITSVSAATLSSSKSFAEFSGRMMQAYSETILRTSTAGLWIQPVAVFYRVRATDGNVLYTSPVRIVSAAGWQGTSGTAVQCSVDSSGSGIAVELPAFSVAFETYRLKVTIPDEILPGEWNRLVSSVEICVSPQIHPVDLKAKAACMLTGGQSAPTFTVALPGATSRMASLDSRRRSTAIEVAAIAPSLARTAAVLGAAEKGEHHVSNTHPQSVAEDCGAIASGLRKSNHRDNHTASGRLLRDITPPHSFVARTVAVDGDSALWAGITPLPFAGFQPGEWIDSRDNSGQDTTADEWDALSIVTLADGRRLTALSSGNGFRPTAIGPLLHYPSTHARTMEFWVRKSTAVYKAAVQLSPDSAGTGAWFLNSQLAAVELQPTSEKMPDAGTATSPGKEQSGFLASAPSTAMLNPVSCVECSRGSINRLVAASRSLSSWDFSRSHIYAFASDGIYAVAVNAANRIASASLINSRGTDGRNTVTQTHDAVMTLPADGGDALLVKASRAVALAMPARFKSCAVSQKNGEVWLADADGRVRIMAPDGTFSRIGEVAASLHCAGGIPLVDTGSRLLRQSDIPAENNTIEWKHTVRTDMCSAVCAVTWLISASMFKGTLSVRAHGGSGQTYPVTACNVEGMVNSPVMLRVVSPPRPYVSLEIKASVSGDFRFEGVELHMTKPFRP